MTARYELFGPVAAGGMATVHFGRVRGGAGFARIVAIKRLHRELAQVPEIAASLVDEARLASRIHHPNVVPILDVVERDGELWLVMEYVAGESLAGVLTASWKRRELLPPPVASAIVGEVLRGLDAAHTARSERGEPLGIVHRDVSPQNVLVGADGLARLVDFGVAKARSRITSTRAGELKGKLGYMAPEQIMAGEVGPATDVFAAAIVLWEALAGARLFAADNEGQVVLKIMEAKVVPPSAAGARTSAALDAVVLRGLARDPRERFATAAAFARELARVEPPAPAADVAAWVERTVGHRLAERAARVAEIEAADPEAPLPRAAPARRPTFALADDPTADDGAASRSAPAIAIGSGSAVGAVARSTPAPARRSRWPLALVAFAVGAAGAGAVALVHVGPAPAAAQSSNAAPGAAAVVSSPAPAAAPPPPPTASETASAVASSPPLEPKPPARRNAFVGSPAPRSPHPTATAAHPSCNPPFTVDADGIQHLKPECAR